MKASIYKFRKEGLSNFETPQKAYDYYFFMLKNNPESSVYPNSLREFDKGVLLGLACHNEVNSSNIQEVL